MEKKTKILVVDDEPNICKSMERYLKKQSYEVSLAHNGVDALEQCASFNPEVILLDIRMPGMSGLDVLKAVNPNESDIAVIMVTAEGGLNTAILAMKAGAYDYISKPVNLEEVSISINKALEKKKLIIENKQMTDELIIKNEKLTELDEIKNMLLQFIVHDLRNPISYVKANLEFILKEYKDDFVKDMHKIIDASYRGVLQITNMVTAILTITKVEDKQLELELEKVNINNLVKEAADLVAEKIKSKNGLICRELASDIPMIKCDRELIERVIGNLLSNAINYIPSGGGTITLKTLYDGERVHVKVRDTGMGIPKEFLPKIFDKYAQAKQRAKTGAKYSSGLGLTFCKMVVEAHGGKIHAESEEGKGSEFTFSLPLS